VVQISFLRELLSFPLSLFFKLGDLWSGDFHTAALCAPKYNTGAKVLLSQNIKDNDNNGTGRRTALLFLPLPCELKATPFSTLVSSC